MLARRLVAAVDWLTIQPEARAVPVILAASGAEAAVALLAAAELPDRVRAVVSCGGQPALAGDALRRVRIPALLLADSEDPESVRRNQEAAQGLAGPYVVREVPGVARQFEEPGTVERVADVIKEWCDDLLTSA
jgi:pimeloyl-ACP methyl ester carboxylesterase